MRHIAYQPIILRHQKPWFVLINSNKTGKCSERFEQNRDYGTIYPSWNNHPVRLHLNEPFSANIPVSRPKDSLLGPKTALNSSVFGPTKFCEDRALL